VSNTGSNNVSSFYAKHDLIVKEASAGPGNAPIDAALSENSKFLYVLNSGNETINGFAAEHDGGLSLLQTVTGLPNGATGLVSQ
jgi:6-phosphogluconolactonase